MINFIRLEKKLPLTTSVMSDTSKHHVTYDFKIINLLPGVQGSSLSMPNTLNALLHCFIFLEITLAELQKAFREKINSLMWEELDTYLHLTLPYSQEISSKILNNPFKLFEMKALMNNNKLINWLKVLSLDSNLFTFSILPYYRGYCTTEFQRFFTYEYE
jgi:hypothetical protein